MKVLVVGLVGPQVQALKGLLPEEVKLKVLSLAQALRVNRSYPDLVVLTRFLSHKHSCRLRRHVRAPIRVAPHGGAAAVAGVVIQATKAQVVA
jgi:hypothetical protein